MDNLSFEWKGPNAFAVEVVRPIKHVSMEFAPHGRPMYITLWRPDGTGLRVHSEMHDLADRIEVGVLSFSHVSSPSGGEEMLAISSEFDHEINASKLVIHESGTSAESGVLLRANNSKEITIIAGANPYSLAVSGVLQIPHIFEPEYPLEKYTCIPIA